jgi:hypothetical protein
MTEAASHRWLGPVLSSSQIRDRVVQRSKETAMKIKVCVIDFQLPAVLKLRLLRVGIPIILLAGAGAVAYASVSKTWNAGETLTANDLNGNFAAFDQRITALETKLVETRNGKKWSLGATYCGTSVTTNGQITGGYAGAKMLCEGVSTGCNSSPSAHMCTAEDLVHSAQVGLAAPQGWYSSGVFWEITTINPAVLVADCSGWTTSSSAQWGSIWLPNGPGVEPCNVSFPVLCCD